MAFGAGTREWVRGTVAKISASSVALGQGELLVDDAGGVYGGDGTTLIKALSRLVRLSELTSALQNKADLISGKVPISQLDLTAVATSSTLTAAFISPTQLDTRVNTLIGNAPAILDTFGEIAAQIQADESGVAALVTRVTNDETAISNNAAAISNLQGAVAAFYNGGMVA